MGGNSSSGQNVEKPYGMEMGSLYGENIGEPHGVCMNLSFLNWN